MDFESYDFFGSSSYGSMGSGFYGLGTNYDNWSVADYIPSPATVSVYASGTSDGIAYHPSWTSTQPATDTSVPAPVPSINLAASAPNAVDYFGGLTTAGSSLLGALATYAGQTQAAVTAFERSVVNHVVALPSIAGSLVSLAQVVDAYRHGDDRGVMTNAGNAIGGLTAAEITALVITTAGAPALTAASALALASMAGGVFGALAGAAIHDMLTGKITEQQGDQLQAAAHTAMDRFYVKNPQYARYAEQ